MRLVTGYFVSTEKSDDTGHLEKSRRSGKSIQSDELWRPGSTVLVDKPAYIPVIPDDLMQKPYSLLHPDIGLVAHSLVYPYTLANPDRLTNPDGQFLWDSRLNPDTQK